MVKKFFVLTLIFLLTMASILIFSGEIKKLSKFGFKGETGKVIVVVDTEVTRLRESENYLPIYVFLNNGENKSINAGRESFILVTPDGESLTLPSYEEVLKNYGAIKISNDYSNLEKLDDYATQSFLISERIPKVAFFPNPSTSSVLYDKVQLPNRYYFGAFLYFPNKAKGNNGIYTLIFEDKDANVRVETPFTIEWFKK